MGQPMKLSHSQLNGWTGCGQRHYLERVRQVPQVPAWNLIGGSAVHETTEWRDMNRHGVVLTSKSPDFEENFERLTVAAEEESGMSRDVFRASGRASKAYPEKEDARWWLDNGPAMCDRWDTFAATVPWDIWITPDGKPAVEIGFELPLDPDVNGEPRVMLRGYIDVVMVERATGNLRVVDKKTGASKQFSPRQLGTYRVGLRHAYGVDALVGSFWDARTGSATTADLNEYTYERLEWHYQKLRMSKELGIYLPNPGPMCGSCAVNSHCFEYNPAVLAEVRPPWVSEEEWDQ